MAIKYAERVKEVATNKPNASSAFNLPDSAATGFQSFDSAFSTGDLVPYMATNGTDWESGIGTFTAGTPDTLARTTLLSSSTGSVIDFSAGADIEVFCSYPAMVANDRAIDAQIAKSGLRLVFNSTTSISVNPGFAYIPGINRVVEVTSQLTASGLTSLTANTWYYVYLYDNAGTPAIEVSATAPAAPYAGVSRTKTGDTSRRFIGAFHTIAGGAIQGFTHYPLMGFYEYGGASSPYTRILSNGTSTSDVTVSAAVGVPPQSNIVYLRCINTATSGGAGGVGIAPGGTTDAYNNSTYVTDNSKDMVLFVPTDASQNVVYKWLNSPGSGLYLDIVGFLLEV